jgi:hypothetical protein
VTVTDIEADVTKVEIVDQALNVIGAEFAPFPPDGTVQVTLTRPLVHLELITADVSNANGTTSSTPLEVGDGNGDILVCIGIQETGDTGPLGSPGSTTGAIEWIGAASAVNGAPQGTPLSPGTTWIPLTFDPAVGPILNFFGGNGMIDGTRGTLEHLALSVDSLSANRSSGPYRLYVDNVVNVGAGTGGSDFVIADFEGAPLGGQVLFRQPSFSGSTDQNLAAAPNSSETSLAFGNPGQSQELRWFWLDTTDQRWIRVTTFGTAISPSPIIDLTKPIRIDLLLVEDCPTFKGDLTGDGVIDGDDLAALTACMVGPDVPSGISCVCADFDEDGDVDLDDVAEMLDAIGS